MKKQRFFNYIFLKGLISRTMSSGMSGSGISFFDCISSNFFFQHPSESTYSMTLGEMSDSNVCLFLSLGERGNLLFARDLAVILCRCWTYLFASIEPLIEQKQLYFILVDLLEHICLLLQFKSQVVPSARADFVFMGVVSIFLGGAIYCVRGGAHACVLNLVGV
jgi:hypothetical protein